VIFCSTKKDRKHSITGSFRNSQNWKQKSLFLRYILSFTRYVFIFEFDLPICTLIKYFWKIFLGILFSIMIFEPRMSLKNTHCFFHVTKSIVPLQKKAQQTHPKAALKASNPKKFYKRDRHWKANKIKNTEWEEILAWLHPKVYLLNIKNHEKSKLLPIGLCSTPYLKYIIDLFH